MIRYTPDGKVDRSEWYKASDGEHFSVDGGGSYGLKVWDNPPTLEALADALDAANAKLRIAVSLLTRVLACGLNEEPSGVGFSPSKQERKAAALAQDISAALRQIEEMK